MSSLLQIDCPQGPCGSLGFEEGYFLNTPGRNAETQISLTLPHRVAPYVSPHLHAIFQMNLPEGRMLEEIGRRLAKTASVDPMMLLAVTGNSDPVGRLRCSLTGQVRSESTPGESLSEILAWDGAQDLFKLLFDRYVMRSGISGVQPKVVVPVQIDEGSTRRATTTTQDLIIKSGQDEYPHLAINEFICMSIAKEAGIPTPDFYLSKNLQMFVMRRFDRLADSTPLGFEDLAVLMNKTPRQKYDGSYEQAAKAVRLFSSEEHRQASLQQFFQTVALSCMLGNGDAHLKNFGMLYTHPGADDARLSPAYDIICTTMYLPDDALALSLGGSKSIFASRVNFGALADACGISDVQGVLDNLVEAAAAVLFTQHELVDMAPGLGECLQRGVAAFDGNRPRNTET